MDEKTKQSIIKAFAGYNSYKCNPMDIPYPAVINYTALRYHHVSTIDQEIAHMWPQPQWNLGKVPLLTTRYGDGLRRNAQEKDINGKKAGRGGRYSVI